MLKIEKTPCREDFAAVKIGARTLKSAAKYAMDKGGGNKTSVFAVLAGTVVGAVNGLFGAGGGMLAVPVLTGILKLPEKQAHATAIAVILPLCAVSAVVYALRGSYDYGLFAPSIAGIIIGGIIGALALKKTNNAVLKFVFYFLMLAAGFKMLF